MAHRRGNRPATALIRAQMAGWKICSPSCAVSSKRTISLFPSRWTAYNRIIEPQALLSAVRAGLADGWSSVHPDGQDVPTPRNHAAGIIDEKDGQHGPLPDCPYFYRPRVPTPCALIFCIKPAKNSIKVWRAGAWLAPGRPEWRPQRLAFRSGSDEGDAAGDKEQQGCEHDG